MPDHAPDQSIRVTCSFIGDRIDVEDIELLDKVAPASDPLPPRDETPQSGFWYDVLDGQDRPLYRRAMHPPIRFAAERRAHRQGGEVANLPVEQPSSLFFLLLPRLAEARRIVLYSSPLAFDAPLEPATALARFDLPTRWPGEDGA